MEMLAGPKIIDNLNIDCGDRLINIQPSTWMIRQNILQTALARNPGLIPRVEKELDALTISLGARPLSAVYRQFFNEAMTTQLALRPFSGALGWVLERLISYEGSWKKFKPNHAVLGSAPAFLGKHMIYINTPKLSSSEKKSEVWDHEVHHFLDFVDPEQATRLVKADRLKKVKIHLLTSIGLAGSIYALIRGLRRLQGKKSESVSDELHNFMGLWGVVSTATIPLTAWRHYQKSDMEHSANSQSQVNATTSAWIEMMFPEEVVTKEQT